MSNTNWAQLAEEHEVAYLRADICIGSPESYTLDEKRKICEDMEASTAEVDAAMRADFESLPDFARKRLLDMLGAMGDYLTRTGGWEYWRGDWEALGAGVERIDVSI